MKKRNTRHATASALVAGTMIKARFASELTPEVSPPFYTVMISPGNRMFRIRNDDIRRLDETDINEALRGIGIVLGYER